MGDFFFSRVHCVARAGTVLAKRACPPYSRGCPLTAYIPYGLTSLVDVSGQQRAHKNLPTKMSIHMPRTYEPKSSITHSNDFMKQEPKERPRWHCKRMRCRHADTRGSIGRGCVVFFFFSNRARRDISLRPWSPFASLNTTIFPWPLIPRNMRSLTSIVTT